MIQYFPKNVSKIDFYGFNEKQSSISDYNLQSYDIYKNWHSLTPNDMSDYLSEDKKFRVTSDIQTTKPIYYAFNHHNNNYADLGLVNDNPNIYFQFSQQKIVNSIKFQLNNIVSPFILTFYASIDNNIWKQIDSFVIGNDKNDDKNNSNNVINYFNKSGSSSYLKYSPYIICKFNNEKKYKYYRLLFNNNDYYGDDIGLRISNMSLYSSYHTLSPIFNFPFKINSNDQNNIIKGMENNVLFQEETAKFHNNSYISYSPILLNRFNDTTITFDAKLLGNECEGDFFSKKIHSDTYFDKEVKFSYKEIKLEGKQPLTFTSLENNNKLSLKFTGYDSLITSEFYYSSDQGKTWNLMELNHNYIVNKNEKIIIINLTENFTVNSNYYYYFYTNGNFNISGDIASLLNFSDTMKKNYQFYRLFANTSIIDASQLILSFKQLTQNAYNRMFINCQSLINAPQILMEALDDFCCYQMFYGCTNLIKAPILLAKKMSSYCYYEMFGGCSSLINPPELPSMELADYCYASMFVNCGSLINAPHLPAKELILGCYSSMFSRCTSLKKLSVEFEEFNSSYTNWWVQGIGNNVNFYKPDNLEIINNNYGIPKNWIVNNLIEENIPDYQNIKYSNISNFYLEVQGGYINNDVKYSLSGKYYLEDNNCCDINCVYKCNEFNGYYEYVPITFSMNIKIVNNKWSFIDDNGIIYYYADNENYNNPQQVERWIVNDSFLASNYMKVINNLNKNIIMFILLLKNENDEYIWLINQSVYSFQIKNQWHHYALTFGKKSDSLYIDCKKILNHKYEQSQNKNMIFNNGYGQLRWGDVDERKEDNFHKIFIKNISFYDYELSENNLRKDMLR